MEENKVYGPITAIKNHIGGNGENNTSSQPQPPITPQRLPNTNQAPNSMASTVGYSPQYNLIIYQMKIKKKD